MLLSRRNSIATLHNPFYVRQVLPLLFTTLAPLSLISRLPPESFLLTSTFPLQIPLWTLYTTSNLSPIPPRRIPAPPHPSSRTTIFASRTCPTRSTTILTSRSRTTTPDTGKAARLVLCRPPTQAVPRVRLFRSRQTVARARTRGR